MTTPAPPIIDQPLPYAERLERRPLEQVDLVVVHCTELPDLATAREYGERVLYGTGTGNSGHYYIDRDGTVLRYVADDRVAHHVRGYNARALGIELVNSGRYPHWQDSRHQGMDEPYTEAQIASLVALLRALQGEAPMVPLQVDGSVVAEIVSAWTGVPLGRMVKDELRVVRQLAPLLRERVIGQDHALEAVAQRVRTASAKLEDPNKPRGVPRVNDRRVLNGIFWVLRF